MTIQLTHVIITTWLTRHNHLLFDPHNPPQLWWWCHPPPLYYTLSLWPISNNSTTQIEQWFLQNHAVYSSDLSHYAHQVIKMVGAILQWSRRKGENKIRIWGISTFSSTFPQQVHGSCSQLKGESLPRLWTNSIYLIIKTCNIDLSS